MISLYEIGTKYKTDKTIHAYLSHYESHFSDKREQEISLLEIGVLYGRSLRMWKDYFPRGKIFGIDAVEEYCFGEERIQCFCGRQENTRFLKRVVDATGDLDFIVDDGGHGAKQHVTSYEFLWDYVKPGGWYCIEDAFSIFNGCWTQPDHNTMFDALGVQWKSIIRSESSIAEVCILGCDTQKEDGRDNGLICLRKAFKEGQDNV